MSSNHYGVLLSDFDGITRSVRRCGIDCQVKIRQAQFVKPIQDTSESRPCLNLVSPSEGLHDDIDPTPVACAEPTFVSRNDDFQSIQDTNECTILRFLRARPPTDISAGGTRNPGCRPLIAIHDPDQVCPHQAEMPCCSPTMTAAPTAPE